MRLDPGNLNNPFGSISRENGKTFRLENFADADLELLQLACDEINDVLLRARVADILWVRFRKHNFALMAVEAYRRIPIRGDSWMLDGVRDCWHRAVVLARQVKQSGEKYLSEMEADLLAASLEEIEVGDMAPTLVEKLLELGLAREHWPSIGEGLVKRSDRISASSGPSVRYLVARTCLSLARHCFNVSKNRERAADVDCQIAALWVEEAKDRTKGAHPSYIIAASHWYEAIRALQVVPRALRATRGVDKLLKEYRIAQREAAVRSMEEFVSIPVAVDDLSEERKLAADFVRGRELLDALDALAQCCDLTQRGPAEEDARKRVGEDFFSRLFTPMMLAEDGRVIARGGLQGDKALSGGEGSEAVWLKLIQGHAIDVRNRVDVAIMPILTQIRLEHHITGYDLAIVVMSSGIVPPERVALITKGLLAGFDDDFCVALHLLVPQLEHLVRVHLQNVGAKTTTTEKGPLQMEAGLSTLVLMPEMESIFGKDLTFEIRALFCDGFGPNLRNKLAHGLLHPSEFYTAASVYAWWLIFRIIYEQYWGYVEQ
jgi:hypothetical protein